MGFLDILADWLAPSVSAPPAVAVPAEPEFPAVPELLPKFPAKTAIEICRNSKPGTEARGLLTLTQSPSQFLSALQEKHLSAEMAKVLAFGLPDREGVAWAAKCAAKVIHLLPPTEVAALQVAQAWVKRPTAEKRAEAAAILRGKELNGPGTWAAQAAAWADGGAPKPPRGVAPRLTPEAVAAAVLLSSTIQARPQFAMPPLPPMHVPTAAELLQGRAPVVAGVVGQLQAGGSVPQVLAGLAAPAVGAITGAAGNVALPVAGGVVGAAAQYFANAGQLPAMGTLAAGVAGGAMASLAGAGASAGSMSLPGATVPSMPGVSGSMPTLPSASIPQANMSSLQMPVIPPGVHAFVFREQQEFIALGIAIASGQAPLV